MLQFTEPMKIAQPIYINPALMLQFTKPMKNRPAHSSSLSSVSCYRVPILTPVPVT